MYQDRRASILTSYWRSSVTPGLLGDINAVPVGSLHTQLISGGEILSVDWLCGCHQWLDIDMV